MLDANVGKVGSHFKVEREKIFFIKSRGVGQKLIKLRVVGQKLFILNSYVWYKALYRKF